MKNIRKILFITQSNIGDIILTIPALCAVHKKYNASKIHIMTSPACVEVFCDFPYVEKTIAYNKFLALRKKIELIRKLRKERYDIIVDFRNSIIPYLAGAKHIVGLLDRVDGNRKHKKDVFLAKLKKLKLDSASVRGDFFISSINQNNVEKIFSTFDRQKPVVVIAAGSKSGLKIMPLEKYSYIVKYLIDNMNANIILVGDEGDKEINTKIKNENPQAIDLTGKTNLQELTCIIKRSNLLITNDSAPLHIGSIVNAKIIAIFGPTSPVQYGPSSDCSFVFQRSFPCVPCKKARCKYNIHYCTACIGEDKVATVAQQLLRNEKIIFKQDAKRFFVARTDRIGDVILSTPVIATLKNIFPNSYISMAVSTYTKDIVDGNRELDEIMVYDKKTKEKGIIGNICFALKMKKRKFDVAIILHPTTRMHLVAFLAGIPKRIGYNRKMSFLLTDKIQHTKHLGEKHESEYNFDLLKPLGIPADGSDIFMPIKKSSDDRIDEIFRKFNIKDEAIVVINPTASCKSKMWPKEYFTQFIWKLFNNYKDKNCGLKIFLISEKADSEEVKYINKNFHDGLINLTGKLSISELASLLKRCSLFVTNDSGPMHIAASFKVPTIAIFGRNNPGLSVRRWKPLNPKCYIFHKDVGCTKCFAHMCKNGFKCLSSISIDEVYKIANDMLAQIPSKT